MIVEAGKSQQTHRQSQTEVTNASHPRDANQPVMTLHWNVCVRMCVCKQKSLWRDEMQKCQEVSRKHKERKELLSVFPELGYMWNVVNEKEQKGKLKLLSFVNLRTWENFLKSPFEMKRTCLIFLLDSPLAHIENK